MFNETEEFPQDSTSNKLLSRPSTLVLTLNYFYTLNKGIRVESVVAIILIQHIFMKQ